MLDYCVYSDSHNSNMAGTVRRINKEIGKMINSFADIWAAFAVAMMIPLVILAWLALYDELTRRLEK